MHITPEKTMIAFEIQDMTCGHCREAITRAVLGVDSAAEVEVDLARRHVQIKSATVGAKRFCDAITDAGHAPTRMTKQDERPASRAGGCSCAGAGASCGMRLGDFLAAPGATPRRPDRQAEIDARPVTGGRCCSAGDAICST
jgi:copper chaperone